jgi:hypothetical protein
MVVPCYVRLRGILRDTRPHDTFWLTVATIDAALAIALVVEGRTARDEMDRIDAERSNAAVAAWEAFQARADAHAKGQGPNPGPAPSPLRPVSTADQVARAERVSLAWLGLSAIALGLVLCLILASPLPDIATGLAAVGGLLALVCLVVGLTLLVEMTTRRMTGVGYRKAVQRLFRSSKGN